MPREGRGLSEQVLSANPTCEAATTEEQMFFKLGAEKYARSNNWLQVFMVRLVLQNTNLHSRPEEAGAKGQEVASGHPVGARDGFIPRLHGLRQQLEGLASPSNPDRSG